ncbi:MAG: recombinase family protein, partial [Planctomycetota bacterium]
DTLAMSERLDKAGANLVSLSESIDTTSASGRMVFKMLAVLAEFERELLSERTSSAMRQMVKRGERVGRYAQFGYRLLPGGVMRECPEEQNVVAMIRRLAAVHLDAAAIARQLNSMGVTCRSRLWRAQTVARVLGRV